MILDSIHKLIERTDLTKQETFDNFIEIMSGKASEAVIASYLTALRMKGETVQEISGAASAMREMSTKISTKHPNVIDTCGTGGDGLGTFNISTASAIVAAAAGAVVAKHGNRAVSSKCGSADVLKALGVHIDIPKEKIEQCLDNVGIAFLFAPILHGAMKYAAPVRRELGIRTIFNILGPLTNPAGAKRQVLGVYRRGLTDVLSNVLLDLGTERALVIHGYGGMDEFSTLGETRVSEIKNGKISSYAFHFESVNVPSADLSAIAGGDIETNKNILLSVLSGTKSSARDIVVLNSGAAIYVAGLSDTIGDGIERAMEAIDDGSASKKLNDLVECSHA